MFGFCKRCNDARNTCIFVGMSVFAPEIRKLGFGGHGSLHALTLTHSALFLL